MSETDVIEIARTALIATIVVGGPLMLIALVVGLIISLFQALTQIQEQTLTFVPKIVILFAAMVVLLPFMLGHMRTLTMDLTDRIVAIGLSGE